MEYEYFYKHIRFDKGDMDSKRAGKFYTIDLKEAIENASKKGWIYFESINAGGRMSPRSEANIIYSDVMLVFRREKKSV